ncbi:MAG: GNAT family N-acetyltransferase [Flavobacteriaceae bacterium]
MGKALLKHAQDYAQQLGVKGISLETEKTNAIGNGLYPEMGFEKDTEHHFYYWENPTF